MFYKLYKGEKKQQDALSTCTSDASYLHLPQPANKQQNLFYYDLILPSATTNAGSYSSSYTGAIWLDISKASSWSNWAKNAASSGDYYTMTFKAGERDKNWNRVPDTHKYMFVCTVVFE